MLDLGRLVDRGIKGKEPLPAPFKSWADRGMFIYPGSVTLIAGKPGTYKSMVVANMVANMRVKTLVFSNDTDDLTTAARLMGIATGEPTDLWRERIIRRDPRASAILRKHYSHVKWAFSPDPSLTEVWLHTHAWAERYGEWPKLIVIDIASNVYVDDGNGGNRDEWASLRELMRQANNLARETGSAVLVVHHCAEGAKTTDTLPCPTRADVMGKIAALPVLMVTLGKDSRGGLHAACVKARNAPSDDSARNSFPMAVDPATSRVHDYDSSPFRSQGAYVPTTWPAQGGWEGQTG